MIKFDYTAKDVKALHKSEGISLGAAVIKLEKQELLERIEDARGFKSVGHLADVVEYLVKQL